MVVTAVGYGHATAAAGNEGGAVEFLTEPFQDTVLADAIRQAIERSRAQVAARVGDAVLQTCYTPLTPASAR